MVTAQTDILEVAATSSKSRPLSGATIPLRSDRLIRRGRPA
jgi:hypothetical protein